MQAVTRPRAVALQAHQEARPRRRLRPALALATRVCLSLACLGVAGFAINTTAASFNSAVQSTSNTFTTGSLAMTNAGTSACTAVTGGNCGTILLSSNSGMSPGDVATGTIKITNAGNVPGTLTLTASRDSATTAGFDADLNLTIYDNDSGYCIYGHSGTPYNSPCDNITGLTAQASSDAFPTASTARGPLTLPALSPNGNSWQAAEAHTLTVTVGLINSTSVPTSATGSLDLSWTSSALAGTAH
jgi:hypothetical protein